MGASIIWFRQDLRLNDNPALAWAASGGRAVIPVYIWAPEEEGKWPPGAASRWWLHHSLENLDTCLRSLGSRLLIRRGPSLRVLRELAKETGASAVCWNRRSEPAAVLRDAAVERELRRRGWEVRSFNGSLLFEPHEVRTSEGGPFQVFTPFWNRCSRLPAPPEPEGAPRELSGPGRWPPSLPLATLSLLPALGWAEGFRDVWKPGEAGAETRLRRLLAGPLSDYPEGRERPDLAGTSGLSPHLHFGEISPRRIWHALQEHEARSAGRPRRACAEGFLRQLGWREFAQHLLAHFPATAEKPLRSRFTRFPWRRSGRDRKAWRRGRTGFPLVDAGMRELWATGWMHNRIRMVVASFLVKDLRLHWLEGARWFWDTLVDADLANNTLGWQWAAGCGADAAPYFRIFNPVAQGEKFDPHGDYVRRWVPELKGLPGRWIQKPFQASASLLSGGGVELGRSYPFPLVDHAAARKRALAALKTLRRQPRPARKTR
jgi:deoxyribodipyrimidine photo-lyase